MNVKCINIAQYLLLSGIGLMIITQSHAQDLERIGKDKQWFKINGNLGANQIYYQAFGIQNRRTPYSYFFTGNVNVNIYGLNIPVSGIYSNQNSQFQQPFNQFSAQPYYRWAKMHLGYNSLNLSPYTMNGHMYLGGAIILTPGICRATVFYGRLFRAIAEDTLVGNLPYYERWGGGIKIGLGQKNNAIDMVLFTAKDDPNSIPTPVKAVVTPAENTAMALIVSKQLPLNIVFTGEYALSALNGNAQNNVLTDANTAGFDNLVLRNTPFYIQKAGGSLYKAYQANLTYHAGKYTIGATFENIDPGYRTLGSYFFNNDMRNYTLNSSAKLLNQKLSLNARAGFQHNNLKNDKISQLARYIVMLNANLVATERLTFTLGYSNFQSSTRIRPVYERYTYATPQDTLQLNSLDFVQLTQQINFSTLYTLPQSADLNIRNQFSFSLSAQDIGNAGQSNQRVATGSRFYTGVAGYIRSNKQKNLNLTFQLNTNLYTLAESSGATVGPVASGNKSFFKKKLKLTISTSWLNGLANGQKTSDIINTRISGTYAIGNHHSFNTYITLLHRITYLQETSISYTELTFNSGYTFTF